MSDVPHLKEQLLINALLHEINGKASSIIDSFSSWLLGGFAAMAALFVSQYDSVSKHIGPAMLHKVLVVFLCILILGLIQKYIAVLIASASQSASVSRQIYEKFGEKLNGLDSKYILHEIKKPIFPPMRWFVGKSFDKAQNGDLISGVHKLTRFAQIQGFLCMGQVILVLYMSAKIACSFHA